MFICRADYPVVKTRYGKLKGYCLDDIFIFRGIKYADAKRFQMPEELQPWKGTKDALSYGYVAKLMSDPVPNGEIMVQHQYWPTSEDCQYLNIWTPSIERTAKKPVMVWLHGGGFDEGSSIEQTAYDGMNMSRYGDVVVITLNHRLNILGYWDLSELGEKYWNTGNLGNADIVAALQWIRNNIEGFGGDPDNVTLFGQSGGGMKVWSLMQMPAAKGLFHKGIIQSGIAVDLFDSNPEANHAIIKELRERGLDDGDILEKMPYEELVKEYKQIETRLAADGYAVVRGPVENPYYLGNPLKRGFCDWAKKIPLIVGSVFGEFDFSHGIDKKYEYEEDEIQKMLTKRFGKSTKKLISLFETAYPEKHKLDLLSLDSLIRFADIKFIEERCKTKESKTYSYLFNYEFALDGGKPAWHCSEIPFVFHNIEKIPVCNESENMEQLQEQIFSAWIHFARTGRPQIADIVWPECRKDEENILILDKKCEVRTNFDHALIKYHKDHTVPAYTEQDTILH